MYFPRQRLHNLFTHLVICILKETCFNRKIFIYFCWWLVASLITYDTDCIAFIKRHLLLCRVRCFFLRMSILNNVKVTYIRILARNRERSSSTRTKQDSQFSLLLLSPFLINVSLYYVGNNEVSSITNERMAQYLISKMAG